MCTRRQRFTTCRGRYQSAAVCQGTLAGAYPRWRPAASGSAHACRRWRPPAPPAAVGTRPGDARTRTVAPSGGAPPACTAPAQNATKSQRPARSREAAGGYLVRRASLPIVFLLVAPVAQHPSRCALHGRHGARLQTVDSFTTSNRK